MKIKKGDKVIVIAGKDKGKTGTVLRAFPKTDQVVMEGINMVKKHRRATRGGKGQVIEKPLPLHISNVQIVDPKTQKPTRVRIERSKGYSRVTTKSGSTLA